MKIKWYGAASLVIESEGARIALDPYVNRNPSLPRMKPEDLKGVDGVLVTHGHFDHTADLPYLINNSSIPVYASQETFEALSSVSEFAEVNLKPAVPEKPIVSGALTCIPYPASHVRFDIPLIIKTLAGIIPSLIKRSEPLMRIKSDFLKYPMGSTIAWEIRSSDRSVLVFGSMGFAEGQEYPSTNLLVLPLQGHSSIHKMAVQAAVRIKPSAVMAFHFDDSFPPVSSSIDTGKFVKMMSLQMPQAGVFIPSYGEEILI